MLKWLKNRLSNSEREDGSKSIPLKYKLQGGDILGEFKEGAALLQRTVQIDGHEYLRFGYVNNEGILFVKPIYFAGTSFSEGLAGVDSGKQWGYIDMSGNYALGPYNKPQGSFCLGVFMNGRARMLLGNETKYLHKDGSLSDFNQSSSSADNDTSPPKVVNFDECIRGLSSSNDMKRLEALRKLRELNDERATPYLIDMLQTTNFQLMHECLFALGGLGSKDKITPLLSLVHDTRPTFGDNNPVGELALWALKNVHEQRVLDAAMAVAQSNTREDMREAAVRVIRNYKDDSAQEILINLLNDRRVGVARSAAEALRHNGDASTIPVLEEMAAKASDAGVKKNCVESVAYIKRILAGPSNLVFAFTPRFDFDTERGSYSEGLVVYRYWDKIRKTGFYGFLNNKGETAIEHNWYYSKRFSEGLAWVRNKEGMHGYIDKQGKLVIPFRFYNAADFSEGRARVCMDNKFEYGYINLKGDLVIDCQFDGWTREFSEGLTRVRKNGLCGFIDYDGKLIIPYEFKETGDHFSEGLVWVKKDSLIGFIDKAGKQVIDYKYRKASLFSEGLAMVGNEEYSFGFIDKKGELVIPFEYSSDSRDFSDGLAAVRRRGRDKFGYIKKTGDMVIPDNFEEAHDFIDGIARVKFDGNYGFIDKDGKYIVKPTLEGASDFSEGLAAVEVDEQWGFIKKPSGKQEENQGEVQLKDESRQVTFWSDILRQYKDGDDQRTWKILEQYDHKTSYREFPDYDVAYARASGTIESQGVPGNWDSAILENGLDKSKVKSRLLFHLSANKLFQGKGEEAFIQAVQAFHATDQVPTGAAPHVFAFFLLYYIFEAQESTNNQTPVHRLVAMNNPGIEILSSQNTMIKQVSQETTNRCDKALLSAAEQVLRSRFKEREQIGNFPAWY